MLLQYPNRNHKWRNWRQDAFAGVAGECAEASATHWEAGRCLLIRAPDHHQSEAL